MDVFYLLLLFSVDRLLVSKPLFLCSQLFNDIGHLCNSMEYCIVVNHSYDFPWIHCDRHRKIRRVKIRYECVQQHDDDVNWLYL